MKLIIASNNKHKVEEISTILQGKFEEIVPLAQTGIVCDPEENGATFLENAIIKATEIGKLCDCCVLADDTGLCVDALNGEPGVFSARYASNCHDDAANRRKLLQNLHGVQNRSAHFECVVVLRYPNGKLVSASGRVDGRILEQELGENGFGYDSLFFSNELGKTFAQATSAEKNAISHRGRALHALLEML
ncbi:MAG: RdgB/HAM1 family non-canonical purine NTP pyrophosphatase [Candidatus Fimimonas sp.]